MSNLKLEYCKNGHEMDKKEILVYRDFEEVIYNCDKCLADKIIRQPKIRGQVLEQ